VDADDDGRPDFIGQEAAALLASATDSEGDPTRAVPAMAPAFVAAANGTGANGGTVTLPPATEGRRVVYLTFDDGPSTVTRQVLQVLRDEGVPATFFVIGNRVRAYAETVRLTVKDGHVIANHTYDHDTAAVYQSPEAFLASLERAGQVIFDTAGVRPTVIRAPGGSKGHFTREYYTLLAENGYTLYDWDVSAADTDPSRPGPEVIAANVLSGVKGRRAPVVLMHDGAGHESTAKALPAIIRGLREDGFEFGTLQPR
ncbi:MAG: polysaccharide deacetylase family protein, partial [Bacillota bacterium]